MNEPHRWLDDADASEVARGLVGALRRPEPLPSSAREAIATRVAATLAATPPAPTGLTPLKVAAGAVVTGGTLALLVWLGVHQGATTAADVKPPVPAALAPTTEAPPEQPAVETAHEVDETAPPHPVKAPPSAPRASARPDTLAMEEALLEQARSAVASSPAKALSLLREHERRFPNGELTAERLFLSAKANQASGNTTAARRNAALLQKRFPTSTYLSRLRSLLESPADAPNPGSD